MKKGKFLLATAAVATAFTCAFGITACKDNETTGSNDSDSQITAVYQLYTANAEANGETVLTYEQWLESIKGSQGPAGPTGATGKSAYEIAKENGFTGTEAEWLASLKGADGTSSSAGKDGKSAYEIAKENGFTGTEAEWLASLKGANGAAGSAGATGATGATGKSAYEIAVENGFEGTEAEWLASLKGTNGSAGEAGAAGATGKSAYEIAVENGFEGTEAEWLASLKGEAGAAGAAGEAGVGIEGVYETSDGLYIKFTDGTAKPVQNGGVEYPLVVLGDNYLVTATAAGTEEGFSITHYSFYSLSGGKYRVTIYTDEMGIAVESEHYFATIGTAMEEPTNSGTFTATAGVKYNFDLYNTVESEVTYKVTIEKV